MNTARFLKYVWPFYNMHERVKLRYIFFFFSPLRGYSLNLLFIITQQNSRGPTLTLLSIIKLCSEKSICFMSLISQLPYWFPEVFGMQLAEIMKCLLWSFWYFNILNSGVLFQWFPVHRIWWHCTWELLTL